MKFDEPGYTRVEIRGIVRAERRPWYRVPGNCRSETKNLLRSGRNGVSTKCFPDTRGNNEHKKKKYPGNILIPAESHEYTQVVLTNEGEVKILTN
jgi:hypothetical protein